MIFFISSLRKILSKRAFSTFKILPFNGRMAWYFRSRACLAEPPAESPSTINSSRSAGSDDWHSASLPGSVASTRAPLLLAISRARLAASRARAASTPLAMIFLATEGFSSKKVLNFSLTSDSTIPLTSLLPSLVLVCPSNCGLVMRTLIMAVIPSRTSSPVILTFRFLGRFPLLAYWLMVRVRPALNPIR